MRVRSFLILLLAASACATPSASSKRRQVCLTDPDRNVLVCDGVDIPWSQSARKVCMSLDDFYEVTDR